MQFLERLAERRIREAVERGDLDDLPGAGRAIPPELELAGVAAELRVAYRILKNAGFLPEEVQLRREIDEVSQLLQECAVNGDEEARLTRRYRLLLQKLGESRAGNLMLQNAYFPALARKIDS